MSLKKVADNAYNEIKQVLGDYQLSQSQTEELRSILENSLKQTAEQFRQINSDTVVQCCGPEADLAHKITEKIQQHSDLLISNLSALR
jgi:signal transduction histidine kinase